MQSFSGIFLSTQPVRLSAPECLYLGRHQLAGKDAVRMSPLAGLVYGRIRNATALKRILDLRTAKPGELLLAAYRRWGEACVEKFEGPCALVVLDQDKNRLLLSRDRMGEVPLFYARSGQTVYFASHPNALLEMGVSNAVDEDGLREIFGLGPARTPGKTPFREIRSLEPGCRLTADEVGVSISTYFSLEAHPHEDSLDTTAETVRALVEQSIDDIAALQPASMLSGGLDSTVLTALLAARSGRPVETYSIDYERNSDFFQGGSYQPEQDAPYVTMASEHLHTRHHRVTLSIEDLTGSLTQAMESRGFPGMADIDSSLYLFASGIARNHKHVLSGECGDEVFGGYPWFHRESLIHSACFPWSGSLALRDSILNRDLAQRLRLAEYTQDAYRQSIATLPTLPGEAADEARLRELQGLCFRFFMTNLQERAACMCASFGLQVLTPFCDERLVQYVYNIPWSMKNTGGQEKGLLRLAMRGLLPDALLYRKKSPYPKTYHPRYALLVTQQLERILSDPAQPIVQLLDVPTLRGLMSGALSPAETPWFGQLMAGPQMLAYLIQVNEWLKRCRLSL